jgi:hypothetical protein
MMLDIEELAKERAVQRDAPTELTLRHRRHHNNKEAADNKGERDSFVPGNATVFVRTWGCGHNNSDGTCAVKRDVEREREGERERSERRGVEL